MRSRRSAWDSQQPWLKGIKIMNTARKGQARKMGANTKMLLLILEYSRTVAKNRPPGHLKKI